MLILLGVLLGNLSAIAVNAFAWHLRRQKPNILIWGSILSFIAFGYFVCFVGFCVLSQEFHRRFMVPDDVNDAELLIIHRIANILMAKTAVCAFLITGIGGLVQMRQIPEKWWRAFLYLWGEVGLWLVPLVLFIYYVFFSHPQIDISSEFVSYFPIAFLVTTTVLTFLRPLCLLWARPFWQVVNEMRIRKA